MLWVAFNPNSHIDISDRKISIPKYLVFGSVLWRNFHFKKLLYGAEDFNLENRRYVIGGVGIAIVLIYTLRLFYSTEFSLMTTIEDTDSNAFLKKIGFPFVVF